MSAYGLELVDGPDWSLRSLLRTMTAKVEDGDDGVEYQITYEMLKKGEVCCGVQGTPPNPTLASRAVAFSRTTPSFQQPCVGIKNAQRVSRDAGVGSLNSRTTVVRTTRNDAATCTCKLHGGIESALHIER